MALRHDIRRGALCMLGAHALFTGMGAIVKHLADHVPVIELMFFRSVFALPVVLAICLRAGGVTLQGPAQSGSEDFAFMLERVPGSYLLIGNGDGDSAGACMVHNPGYDFNDDNIAIGAAYWTLLAERFLTE